MHEFEGEAWVMDEREIEAATRALMKRWIDQANAERYIGGPHTSPMVEPEEFDIDDPPEGMEEQARLDAECVAAVLDRVRDARGDDDETDRQRELRTGVANTTVENYRRALEDVNEMVFAHCRRLGIPLMSPPRVAEALDALAEAAARSPQDEDHETSDHETSDAVRERPTRHLPVNGPDDRQPNAPDRGQLRDAATPASGRGRSSDETQMIDTARKVAQFAYEQSVGEAVAVDDLIAEIEWLRAELEQARINAACVGEMADEAEAEVKRLTAIVDAQTEADR